jgi:hypothetical protein
VGRGQPVIRTKFTKGTGLNAGRGLHQELVNDNYSCSSSGDAAKRCNSAAHPPTTGPVHPHATKTQG